MPSLSPKRSHVTVYEYIELKNITFLALYPLFSHTFILKNCHKWNFVHLLQLKTYFVKT